MEGEGGFPYYYPDSFAGPLPPPQGSAYLLPPQFVGCEPHATLISLRTRTSVFSLPSWRLFVPHIVTDGMLAHRRTGNFLPGGAVIHLPKKFLQVAQIFTKQAKGN